MPFAETIAAVRRHAAIAAAAAALRRARRLAEQSHAERTRWAEQSRWMSPAGGPAAQNKATQNEANFGETKLTGITAELSMGVRGIVDVAA